MGKRLEKKHPLAIRWFHWLNLPLLLMMIYSGLMIYWANDAYRIQLGNQLLLRFFPQGFYDALHLPFRLAEGMAWHFTLMWLFALNGVAYVLYTFFSGEWRYLVPTRASFGEALQVLRHDFGFSKEPLPKRKFNGAQQIAYSSIILCGLGSLLTGLAIYKPVQFGWLCGLLGGYEAARLEHFILTLGYVAFIVIHLIQVARAGWNNFQAMVSGYELVTDLPTQLSQPLEASADAVAADAVGRPGHEA